MKRFELGYVAPYNIPVSDNIKNRLNSLNKKMDKIYPVLSGEYLVPGRLKKMCLEKKAELDEEFKRICKSQGWI